ncbi:MAG: hypothetical protein JXB00_14635 [Bacteroidales bacterium]|nr:hypothetical protein [Bacteroidales bacterium]
MKYIFFYRFMIKSILLFTIILVSENICAQHTKDSVKVKSLYRPPVSIQQDTLPVSDSVLLREQFIYDSLLARQAFIRDSIAAREQFVRDSIAKRQRILDSLNMLRQVLPQLLDATIKTLKEDIIINQQKICIIGDSTLCNYTFNVLPFNLSQPYTPWKGEINLSDNPVRMEFSANNQVKSLQAPGLTCTFVYGKNGKILRINEKAVILNKSTGKLYKEPFDSVFFDVRGRVAKIKRYIHFSQATDSYRKGASLFVHLTQVKQFDYDNDNQVTKMNVVNFCDRWSAATEHKVCNIITYSFNKQGNTYFITRKNDPANNYSDGTFTIEFDAMENLKSLSFLNSGKSENWKTHVEVNQDGNVKRYLYEINGKINQTLDFNYFLNDPQAKYPVEQIKCTFEDDGVSYYQLNTTTGKSRTRDRMTGEWSPWR